MLRLYSARFAHVRSHSFCRRVFNRPTGKAQWFSFESLGVALGGGELIAETMYKKILTNYRFTDRTRGLQHRRRIMAALGPEPVMTLPKCVCTLSDLSTYSDFLPDSARIKLRF